MSTSKKHRSFVGEPIGGKSVTDVPGIGSTLGGRLKSAGIHKAEHVVGQYMVMDGDKERFTSFMKSTTKANARQASECYEAVKSWHENNMY